MTGLQDAFLEALEGMGGAARNPELQQAMGWDQAQYDAVKVALVARGILVKGRGRSNAVSIRGMEAALPPRSASSNGNGAGRRGRGRLVPCQLGPNGADLAPEFLYEVAQQASLSVS